jgi:UTP--glucose-1-phosphate uridylyltransferase
LRTPEIFNILDETSAGKCGEIQWIEALKTQASQGRLLAYQFEDRRFDCGSVHGSVEAIKLF